MDDNPRSKQRVAVVLIRDTATLYCGLYRFGFSYSHHRMADCRV